MAVPDGARGVYVDHLQRPGKVFWQVEVGDCALAFGAQISNLLAAHLIGLLDFNDLWIEWRLLITIKLQPCLHIRLAGGDVRWRLHFTLDRPRSLIALRLRRIECAAEAQCI